MLFTLPLSNQDRAFYINYYTHQTSDYNSRGGTITILPLLDYSNVSLIDDGNGSLDIGFGAIINGTNLEFYYGVNYGNWTFDYSVTVLSTPIASAPVYYGLSNYGGSPLITHYTQIKLNVGECLCGNDDVKYESFGIIATIGGLTEVTGFKLDDCSFGCP